MSTQRGDDVADDAEPLVIRLFGMPRCEAGHQTFFPIKGLVLIAALLLSPSRFLTRQAAAFLLWENAEEKRAAANLRQLLLRLQQHAIDGEPFVVSTMAGLTVGPATRRSDLEAFLLSLKDEDIDSRLKGLLAVTGELLQGVEAGTEQFDFWLLSQRNRLNDQFYSAVNRLLDDVTRFGTRKSVDIATIADRALQLEPDREETYRLFMNAYARAGDLAASDRIFDRLIRHTQLDGRSPESETLALHRRLRARVEAIALSPSASSAGATCRRPRVAFLRPTKIDGSSFPSFVQAFVEDIANSLVRYRTFAVISPHSSFLTSDDASNGLYRTLRADYCVKATVFDNMRLSFAMIEEATGEIVWSLEVVLAERQLHSAFRMLSKQIAAALAEQIERLQLAPARQHDGGAYHHLLSGQQLLRGKCDLPLLRRARSEFRKAIEIDPQMSVARARTAQSLQLEWLMLGGDDPHLLHRAKAEAEAAIEIDPALGIGHWMRAVVALYQRDFETSAQGFFEAEALAPNSADLLIQHADALAHFGEKDLAWQRFQQAIDLNPLAPDIYWWAGASIALKRDDYRTAVDLCTKMENDEPALRVLTASHALNGNLEAARGYARRLQEIYPGLSAREISGVSPDKDPAANEKLYTAFRLAGIK
ncbi:BTAD domain-containing putative transcriptional regulator [Rhizobium daejeonense]|uniref:BTAD domain-containing putative transcriptional regulator n=1 Tax=Rhizobium daejeonense TaxID=240521 RepID=UPI00164418B2|nr:BTAD domain-containing putative transcriptional regulator [Rhizobium daejeonense]